MIYALCRKIDFVENLRVFGVKIWTEISIRVKNLTFSMSDHNGWHFVCLYFQPTRQEEGKNN